MSKTYFVYMLTNWDDTVLYTGVTNNMTRRVYEHKHKLLDGFSKKYNLTKLVYFETSESIDAAILREKQFKRWRRDKKDALVKTINPEWKDLASDFG